MAGGDTTVPLEIISSSSRNNNNSNVVHPQPVQYHYREREVKHYGKWVPWLIPFFVVANIVVFIITMYVNNCPHNSVSCIARFLGRFSFQPFKENPLLGPSSLTLQKVGALDVNRVVHSHQGWRLITCMWLHGGVFHLLANMLGILFIGIRLEQEFGFVLIGLLFVISGFGGSLLSALFIQSNISVGASGALFGLLGGMLSELITNWSIYENKLAALFTLVIIIAVNLAIGILPHVDNFAHIGGFLTGFFLGFVFLIRPQFQYINQRYAPVTHSPTRAGAKPKFKKYQCILWILSLIILIVGLSVGLVALLRGVDANDHCSWCHYLSCVPTSRWSCNTEPAYCVIVHATKVPAFLRFIISYSLLGELVEANMARSHPVHTPADEVARITLIKPQADSAEAASQDRVLVGKFSALKALNRVGVKNNFWKMWDNMQGLHVMDLASNAEVEEELFRRKKQKREAWFDDAGNVICVAITTPEGIQTESVEASLKERVLAGTIIAPRALNRVGVKNNRWKMWEAYKGLHVTDLAINQFAITFQDTDIPDAEGNLVPPSP